MVPASEEDFGEKSITDAPGYTLVVCPLSREMRADRTSVCVPRSGDRRLFLRAPGSRSTGHAQLFFSGSHFL
jgi:hypothetical protein